MKTLSYNILDTIGNTPLLKVKIEGIEVFLKLESFNPGGSIKDRVALAIVEEALKEGKLTPEKVVVEATSGNTGIGIALVCAAKGLNCLIIMPENMSQERIRVLRAYGAQLLLTPAEEGIPGAVRKLEELIKENPEKYYPTRQFENPVNPKVHYSQTSLEILQQMGKLPNLFVSGIGTGGTFTGISRRFKEVNQNCTCVAVEPEGCAVISGGSAGVHKIQGIGPGFIPKTLDTSLIDRVEVVPYQMAKEYSRLLAREFGVLAGISAGANLYAAVKVAKEMGIREGVVTVVPDTGERYLSTDLFE